jgi:CTP:molybdopterin cytidylyltransferase MocA
LPDKREVFEENAMTPLSIAEVILAAGRSSRMGQFKPSLKIDRHTLIQRAISVFQQNRI